MAQQRMNVQAPIQRLFAERWSSRALNPDKAVARDLIASCLEAARWAPSCYGEQPWHYLVVDRFADKVAWEKMLESLAPKNQLWAKHAPVFIASVAEPAFSHNGKRNRWAEFDTGQATICLCLQAASLGLMTHQMGGFDPDSLKQSFELPAQMHVMSVTALGYPGAVDALAQDFQPMEAASRTRKALSEIVHDGHWGAPWQPPAGAGWEARYQDTAMERLPWFHHGLDADFAEAIARLGISDGAVLDVGCGPGTQAVALAKQGFSVTAIDISKSAVSHAELLAETEQVDIIFHVDDVLDLRMSGQFDLLLDRGIFHCFPDTTDQQAYLSAIKRLLKPQGILLLKCFHKDETGEMGPPCRYNEADIRRLFGEGFELVEAHDSQFSSAVMELPPKALFCILKKS
ncbi:MAG: nitroreductase family protein [Mariprofundus sp.]|nr:nitroreductase family protein [Mariprofundus sp.]